MKKTNRKAIPGRSGGFPLTDLGIDDKNRDNFILLVIILPAIYLKKIIVNC